MEIEKITEALNELKNIPRGEPYTSEGLYLLTCLVEDILKIAIHEESEQP